MNLLTILHKSSIFSSRSPICRGRLSVRKLIFFLPCHVKLHCVVHLDKLREVKDLRPTFKGYLQPRVCKTHVVEFIYKIFMQNTVSKSMKKKTDLRRYKVANFACFEKSNQENKAIMKFQWKWRHEVNMKEISLQSFTKIWFYSQNDSYRSDGLTYLLILYSRIRNQ